MGMYSSLPWKPIKGHSKSHVMNNIRCYENAFSARYEAAYMWCFVQQVNAEVEGKCVTNKWQLDQRKWDFYNRPLKQGCLYVLSNVTKKKWQKCYCVLQSDYALAIYKSKEDFEKCANPLVSTKYSGFVVTGDVDGYLHQKLKIRCRDLGYVNPDINAVGRKVTLIGAAGSRPTQHVMLVDHPWRGIVYFATETAIEKEQWLKVLRDSVRHLEGCQYNDEIGRDAFAFAVEQSVRLQEFYVDKSMLSGTQQEILTDLIAAFQSVDCKKVIIPRMSGGIVNRYKAWSWVLTAIHGLIKSVVMKEYSTWRKTCEEKCHKKRSEIIVNLPQINAAYEGTSKVIRATLAECFDPVLINEIIPKLPEVIDTMSDSLVSPLRATREMFKSLVEGLVKQASSSSQFANNIDQYFLLTLDFAPRNPEFFCPSGDMSNRNSAPVAFLENLFPQTDFTMHMSSVYTYQQQLLDSCLCTFETLCGEAVKKDGEGNLTLETIGKVQSRVLKKLDYDILLAQKRFFRSILLSAIMERTRDSIEQGCKSKMLDFEATIPEELQCYLPINNVFTDVLTKRFNELINPVLNSCMKRIGNDSLLVYTHQSPGSVSSFCTIDSGDGPVNLDEVEEPQSRRNSLGEDPDSCVFSNDPEEDTATVSQTHATVESDQQPASDVVVNKPGTNAESGEYCGCDMDGETGEWFPPQRGEENNNSGKLMADDECGEQIDVPSNSCSPQESPPPAVNIPFMQNIPEIICTHNADEELEAKSGLQKMTLTETGEPSPYVCNGSVVNHTIKESLSNGFHETTIPYR